MVKDIAVRLGVLIVLITGMLTLTSGLAVADSPCLWDCEDDEDEEESFYDGPNPDIGGAVSEFIGNVTQYYTVPVTNT